MTKAIILNHNALWDVEGSKQNKKLNQCICEFFHFIIVQLLFHLPFYDELNANDAKTKKNLGIYIFSLPKWPPHRRSGPFPADTQEQCTLTFFALFRLRVPANPAKTTQHVKETSIMLPSRINVFVPRDTRGKCVRMTSMNVLPPI